MLNIVYNGGRRRGKKNTSQSTKVKRNWWVDTKINIY
jgi:hypothetical protein